MSNRSLALVILTGAGLLALVSTLPFVLRSLSPALFEAAGAVLLSTVPPSSSSDDAPPGVMYA